MSQVYGGPCALICENPASPQPESGEFQAARRLFFCPDFFFQVTKSARFVRKGSWFCDVNTSIDNTNTILSPEATFRSLPDVRHCQSYFRRASIPVSSTGCNLFQPGCTPACSCSQGLIRVPQTSGGYRLSHRECLNMAWYAYCIGEKQAFPELARHRKTR